MDRVRADVPLATAGSAPFRDERRGHVASSPTTVTGFGRTETDAEYAADLVDALIGVIKRITALRSRLAGAADSDIGQVFLLVRLAESGPMRSGDLADRVCADPSTVSRQVAGLVKAGMVERRADPVDGRASLLAVTASGMAAIAWHRRMRGQVVGPLIAPWSVPERDTFMRLLQQFAGGLDAHWDAIVAAMAQRPDGGA